VGPTGPAGVTDGGVASVATWYCGYQAPDATSPSGAVVGDYYVKPNQLDGSASTTNTGDLYQFVVLGDGGTSWKVVAIISGGVSSSGLKAGILCPQ